MTSARRPRKFRPHPGPKGRPGLRLAAILAAIVAAMLAPGPLAAETIEEVLAQAYLTNPTLEAQRAQLRATDERVPQALSGYRPTVLGTGSYGPERTGSAGAGGQIGAGLRERLNPASVGVTLTEPIFSGGSTVAQTRQAENLVQAQRATLVASEVNILLSVGQAFVDVVQAQAVVDLNISNEQVLRRQLEADRDRFNVGEITRTDVSQSESRLARAISDRIQAQGSLAITRATFARLVGSPPPRLAAPVIRFALPPSLEEAVALAQNNNPQIVAAQFSEAAAQEDVNRITGQLLPQFNLRAGISRDWDSSIPGGRTDTMSVVGQVTVPLYEAGVITSQVRQAKQVANQRRVQIEDTRRQIIANVVSSWKALITARASITSRQAQMRAAEIALEGVRQEAQVGSRTVLDVLNAEQELLDARVQLVQVQHDEIVAIFQVLAATGQLTAQALKLSVPVYDYEENYRRVRDKWWGTSIER